MRARSNLRHYDAANANYGMLPKDMDAALAGACPILGNYGGKDGQLKDAKPNPADAQDAWLRIEKFFAEHLGS
jgi:dienelactone hydrolase